MDFDRILNLSGTVLSLCCLPFLLTSWVLLPRWRTLHNYIGVNQIFTGTLYFSSLLISKKFTIIFNVNRETSDLYRNYISVFIPLSFLATICWSLCSLLLAYLKLVLLHSSKISYEKRRVTGLVWSMFLVLTSVYYCVTRVFYNESVIDVFAVFAYEIILVMSINFVVFLKITCSVMSCCRKSASQRNARHVISLMGVALLCDSTAIANIFIISFANDTPGYTWLENLCLFCFAHRFVFQALLLLFKKSSRDMWRNYFIRRRQRRNDAINL